MVPQAHTSTHRWIFILIILLVAGGWVGFSHNAGPAGGGHQESRPTEGSRAPDFTLETLSGATASLSTYRGKVVVVNLWASWCGPCQAEMPTLEKVYTANHDRGLEVLAVNGTFQDSEADARAFAQHFGLTFPILLDRDGSVSTRYLLRGLPTTYIIDRRGIIRSVIVGGPIPEAVLLTNVEALLKETS